MVCCFEMLNQSIGIRACFKKIEGGLAGFFKKYNADVYCFQGKE